MFMAACAPSPGESGDTAHSEESPAAQAASNVGDGVGGDVPGISTRTFTGGRAQMKVSGFFAIDAGQDLNKPASLSDGEYTWIQYGDSGAETANATITFGEGDSGVSIGLGSYTATGTSPECSKNVDVTDTTVSGHFSCTGVAGYNKDNGSMGKVNIEIDFVANS
jgi:hypothetical protein